MAAASLTVPTILHAEAGASLASQIVATARKVPAGSGSELYEAQFAALFDRVGATCIEVRDAANETSGLPRVAFIALQRVNRSVSACSGTAAIGGGRANDIGVPGFAVGGGSDYVR